MALFVLIKSRKGKKVNNYMVNNESKEEKIPRKDKEWIELCSWVEKELFNYDTTTHLKKQACLSLMGLRKGKSIANNKTQDYGDYSYNVIKMTFQMHKRLIQDAIRDKDFNGNESSKMRYICAIILNKIDDVNERYKNVQKSEEKIERVNIDIIDYNGAEYKKKNNDTMKNEDKFKELW